MSYVYENAAIRIVDWFHRAEHDLIGAPITTSGGETGVVKDIALDEHHGLCFTLDDPISGFDAECGVSRRWAPVSTIKRKEMVNVIAD
jgi:hypothetical protein